MIRIATLLVLALSLIIACTPTSERSAEHAAAVDRYHGVEVVDPHRWLENISRLGVTLSVAPNFAYRLCLRRVRDKHLAGLDLSRWRIAINGAEMVHDPTVTAFREKFGPVGFSARSMVPVYGLAENTLATACPPLDEPYVTADGVVGVGGPLPGQALSIQGTDGIAAE